MQNKILYTIFLGYETNFGINCLFFGLTNKNMYMHSVDPTNNV